MYYNINYYQVLTFVSLSSVYYLVTFYFRFIIKYIYFFQFPEFKWDVILKEDPESCVPSFICQLAAIPYAELKFPERNVLKLIRYKLFKTCILKKFFTNVFLLQVYKTKKY